MSYAIVYSSKTGNTKLLADTLHDCLPQEGCDYFEYLLTEIPKRVDDKNTDFLAELLPWSDMLPENIRKPQKASGK